MTQYKIIKNAPLLSKIGKEPKYPFEHMSVGDAFDFPAAVRTRIFNASTNWAVKQQPKAKFMTRKIDKDTVRIWRIA